VPKASTPAPTAIHPQGRFVSGYGTRVLDFCTGEDLIFDKKLE